MLTTLTLKNLHMKISVYDTYVKKSNGVIMHFDILVEENNTIENALVFGKKYLTEKKLFNSQLTTKECEFCHIETATLEIEKSISKKGYYIIELENC